MSNTLSNPHAGYAPTAATGLAFREFFALGLQTKIFLASWIGYATFYLTRKSLTYALPGLMKEYGYDTAQIGMLGTVLALTYAVSKLVSGIFADRYSPKWIMIGGLLMTAVANIFLGWNSSYLGLFFLWGMNGLFQGTGAPVCAHYLVNYFPKETRGTWWSLWNTSHNAGGALIPIIAGACLMYATWRSALFIPGIIAIVISVYLIWALPQSSHSHSNIRNSSEHQPKTTLKSLIPLWPIFISYFLIYILRNGIGDWIHIYLIEAKNWAELRATAAVSWFEIGGFLGGLLSGLFSDYYFKGSRVMPCFTMIIGFLISILPLFFFPAIVEQFFFMEICVFFQGFFIFGPHSLLGMAVAEHAGKHLAASATGVAGFLGYFGAALCGWPLGVLIKHYGWNGHFLLMMGLPFFIFVLMKLRNDSK